MLQRNEQATYNHSRVDSYNHHFRKSRLTHYHYAGARAAVEAAEREVIQVQSRRDVV